MRAVVLCAGLGTRLSPLTHSYPKPAIPLLGQPLLRYALAMLRAAGVHWAGINTHHLPKLMQAVASSECRRAGIQLELSYEPLIQGTAGGIRGFRRWLSDEPFLVLNGDILFSFSLAPLVQAHLDSGAMATMALMSMPSGDSYAAVETDGSWRIWRIAGRGASHVRPLQPYHFTGVHVLSPDIFDLMAKSGPEDINREVYLRAIEKGLLLRGHPVDGYWSDLGTPARYLRTQEDLLSGRTSLPADDRASPFHEAREELPGCWLRGRANIDGARVTRPAYFDDGARLLAPAEAGPNVYLGPLAAAGPGTKLEHATVLGETVLEPGENLSNAIAWGEQRLFSSDGNGPARR